MELLDSGKDSVMIDRRLDPDGVERSWHVIKYGRVLLIENDIYDNWMRSVAPINRGRLEFLVDSRLTSAYKISASTIEELRALPNTRSISVEYPKSNTGEPEFIVRSIDPPVDSLPTDKLIDAYKEMLGKFGLSLSDDYFNGHIVSLQLEFPDLT